MYMQQSTGEYASTDRLPNSIISEWYVQISNVTSAFTFGIQYTGAPTMSDIILGFTFNANSNIGSQTGSFVMSSPVTSFVGLTVPLNFSVAVNAIIWCKLSNKTCYLVTQYGAGNTQVATINTTQNTAELVLPYTGYGTSPIVYMQGAIFDNTGNWNAKSPSSGFYGWLLLDKFPAGLPANWNSFPYHSVLNGGWDSGGVWFPTKPPNTNSAGIAATHAVISTDVSVSTSDIFVCHLTQLASYSLSITSATSVIQLGYGTNTSYWTLFDRNKFSFSSNTSLIQIYAPFTITTMDNLTVTLPTIQLSTNLPTPANLEITYGYSADSIRIMNPNVVFYTPSNFVRYLFYGPNGDFNIGNEFPIGASASPDIYVSSGSTVYFPVLPPATKNVNSVAIQNNATFRFTTASTSNVLPQLNITTGINLTGSARFELNAELYIPQIADYSTVHCVDNTKFMVNVWNGTFYQNWPVVLLDEFDFTDLDLLQISQPTDVTIANANELTSILWNSDADSYLCTGNATCSIPAEEATINITAIGNLSNCFTQKTFDVVNTATGGGKSGISKMAIGIVVVVILVAIAIVAVIIFFIVKRKKSGKVEQKNKKADVELTPNIEPKGKETSYDNSLDSDKSTEKIPETKQPLIDPKYEIPYKEITFGPELGRGAFGVVYKCRWRNTDIVVKQLDISNKDKASVELFLKEAVNVLKLRTHPNVCNVFGVCTNPQHPICILMEYLPDGSLEDLLYNNKITLDVKTLLELARDIASGMGHLHAENVLHCDLACRNLLVTTVKDKYVVKIADFGLSRVTDKDTYNANTSTTFPIRWTAPETLRSGKISRASDVWSFGVVLWEIIECKRPYPELSNPEVIKAVCDRGERLPRPDRIEIPTPLWNLMQACWAADPQKRPNFGDIYNVLEEIGKDYWDHMQEKSNLKTSQSDTTNYANNPQTSNSNSTLNTAVYGNQTEQPSHTVLYGNERA